ncbi:uncharacterized protein [Prorops nasuta]|uniref:uncharacterized protein isoform X2 n=1 Tax=Prorops nasuta TaxID=863751 RepID=UPI0034CE0026
MNSKGDIEGTSPEDERNSADTMEGGATDKDVDTLSKPAMILSNGSNLSESNTKYYNNVLVQESNQETINTNVAASVLNYTNIRPQSSSQCQLKQMISSENSLNVVVSQEQSNSSMNASTHNNQAFVVYSSKSTAMPSNVSAISANKANEDPDMKNNVDYASGIEKCPPKVSCSSDSSPEADRVWKLSHYSSKCPLNNIGGSIGSTSQGTCCFLRPNINGNREVPGPSGLQKNLQREPVEMHDSSSGNEGDLSDGEDYCIYTYKGNNEVSLQSKEEDNEELLENHEAEEQYHSGRSSPEMDFLEMDFDPGPSCEQDTGDSDLASINEDIQNLVLDSVETDPVLNDLSSGKIVSRQTNAVVPQNSKQSNPNVVHINSQPCTSSQCNEEINTRHKYPLSWLPNSNTPAGRWESSRFSRSTGCPLKESYGYHSTSGDLISPSDNRDSDSELWAEASMTSSPENSNANSRKVNLSSALYHRMMAKKLMLNKQTAFNQSVDSDLENELRNERLDGLLPVEKVMLWSEHEAIAQQVTQVGTSACGATSAINALLALDVTFSAEVLIKGVATRLREQGTPLPRYLVSRSLAGASHKDIIRGISLSTNGAVVAKFFAFYPERKVSLSHWLHYWISRGAAPIATLNLQHCGEGRDIPDAWHHQMIFGVGQAGIYLTNPLQCVPEQLIWHQLVSPSILLIRRADVLAHWNENTDLTTLAKMDHKWRKLNVLGQVVNMIREAKSHRQQSTNTSIGSTHIRIPASYKTGIILVLRADSPAALELLHSEQLPLL